MTKTIILPSLGSDYIASIVDKNVIPLARGA
jgi:hypothetical protein